MKSSFLLLLAFFIFGQAALAVTYEDVSRALEGDENAIEAVLESMERLALQPFSSGSYLSIANRIDNAARNLNPHARRMMQKYKSKLDAQKSAILGYYLWVGHDRFVNLRFAIHFLIFSGSCGHDYLKRFLDDMRTQNAIDSLVKDLKFLIDPSEDISSSLRYYSTTVLTTRISREQIRDALLAVEANDIWKAFQEYFSEQEEACHREEWCRKLEERRSLLEAAQKAELQHASESTNQAECGACNIL